MDAGTFLKEFEAAKEELRLLRRENEDLKRKVAEMENKIGKQGGVHEHKVHFDALSYCVFCTDILIY